MKLPPTRYVVDGLLPRGLHVFAGPPKVGKSWLLLQLSLAVASGTRFWGLDTATEFTTLLDLDMQPNMLSRKIRSNRQELLRFGVSFEPSRDRQKRSFLLRYVSACDGVTVPTRGGAASSRNPESVANTGESA